ncbi:double zinc ribbon domain-containing protein [Thermoflexus hugenholtzii]
MRRCPVCGALYPEEAQICARCGADPVDGPGEIDGTLCAVCGYRNPPEAVFCEQCGVRLKGAEEEGEVRREEAAGAPPEPGMPEWLLEVQDLFPEAPPAFPETVEEERLPFGAPPVEEAQGPGEAPPSGPEAPILPFLEGTEPEAIPPEEGAPPGPPEAETGMAVPPWMPPETEASPFPELPPLFEVPELGETPPVSEAGFSGEEAPPPETAPFTFFPLEEEAERPPAIEAPSPGGEEVEALPSPWPEGEELPEWWKELGLTEAPSPGSSEEVPARVPPLLAEELPEEVMTAPPATAPFQLEEAPLPPPPEEVPPFTDLEAVLAEMPEWLQTLRPVAEEGGEAPAEALLPLEPVVVEEQGPLAGLVDVLPRDLRLVEVQGPPARLRAEPIPELRTRAEAWGSLLAQGLTFLIGERVAEPAPAGLAQAVERWVLFALILMALILGLYWPLPFFRPALLTPPTAFVAALDEAPSGGVALVAVEYGPDRAAELDGFLRGVLQRLSDRGVRVLTVSLSPWGAAQAASVVLARPDYGERVMHLGYVPGHEVAIARLLSQPLRGFPADYTGRPVRDLPIARDFGEEPLAARVSLVVLITGSPEALRGWLQQARGILPPEAPVIAAVSAGIAPYAAPYQESGQLRAVAAGLRDALLLEGEVAEGSPAFFDLQAQALLQMLVVALIGVGLGISLFAARRREG